MTRYECLEGKVNSLLAAARKAENMQIAQIWLSKAIELNKKALDMSLVEASKELDRGINSLVGGSK